MDDLMQEMRQDVKDLVKLAAAHNELLRQHEARSIALQRSQEHLDLRIDPIEKHVYFVERVLKVSGVLLTGSGLGAVIQAIVHHLVP